MNNLFMKILNNLARPHKIPKKILNKLNYYFSCKRYNQNFFEEEQNKIFEHFGCVFQSLTFFGKMGGSREWGKWQPHCGSDLRTILFLTFLTSSYTSLMVLGIAFLFTNKHI